jgi:hypothetical protein
MDSEEHRDQAENWPQTVEEQRLGREVGRLISERNRKDAEAHRNTMEDMRQVAEELRDSAETQREVVAQKWHESASEGRHADREALGQLKEHVYRLEGRVDRLESLLLGATEQNLRLVQGLYRQMTEEDRRVLIQGAIASAQAMAETAGEMPQNTRRMREEREEG